MGAFVGSTFGELASWTAFSKYSRLLSATGGATLPLPGSAEGASRPTPSGVPAGSRCEHAHGCPSPMAHTHKRKALHPLPDAVGAIRCTL
jgi:hypothetical protein